jgi:lipopolysaccharide exporter
VKNVSLLTAGTILAHGISLIATPILSRLYTPEEFGSLALFMAISSITTTLVGLSFPIRIVLPKEESEASQIVFLSFISSIVIALVLCLIIFLSPEFLFKLSGFGSLNQWLYVAIFSGVLMSMFTISTYWLNRKSQYQKITVGKIIQAVIVAIIGLSFGFFSIEGGLLFAQVLGIFCALLVFISWGVLSLKRVDKKVLFKVIKDHKAAPLNLYPIALLDVITVQLPIFLIAIWYHQSLVGQYRMASSLLSVPSALIGTSIAQVFYQKLVSVWPNANEAKELLFKTWGGLALAGIIPFTVVAIFGNTLFTWILGPTWNTAGEIASVLAIVSFFSLIHSPTSTAYIVLSMEKIVLLLMIPLFFFRILALYIGYLFKDFFIGLYIYVFFELLNVFLFQYLVFKKIEKHIV